MSIEVEIKLKIEDKKELEKKLLELEWIVAEEKEREAVLLELEKILKLLGYSMADTTRRSYLSMLTGEEN